MSSEDSQKHAETAQT